MNKKVKIPQQRYVKGHPGLKRSELEQLSTLEFNKGFIPTEELERLKKLMFPSVKRSKTK